MPFDRKPPVLGQRDLGADRDFGFDAQRIVFVRTIQVELRPVDWFEVVFLERLGIRFGHEIFDGLVVDAGLADVLFEDAARHAPRPETGQLVAVHELAERAFLRLREIGGGDFDIELDLGGRELADGRGHRSRLSGQAWRVCGLRALF